MDKLWRRLLRPVYRLLTFQPWSPWNDNIREYADGLAFFYNKTLNHHISFVEQTRRFSNMLPACLPVRRSRVSLSKSLALQKKVNSSSVALRCLSTIVLVCFTFHSTIQHHRLFISLVCRSIQVHTPCTTTGTDDNHHHWSHNGPCIRLQVSLRINASFSYCSFVFSIYSSSNQLSCSSM